MVSMSMTPMVYLSTDRAPLFQGLSLRIRWTTTSGETTSLVRELPEPHMLVVEAVGALFLAREPTCSSRRWLREHMTKQLPLLKPRSVSGSHPPVLGLIGLLIHWLSSAD